MQCLCIAAAQSQAALLWLQVCTTVSWITAVGLRFTLLQLPDLTTPGPNSADLEPFKAGMVLQQPSAIVMQCARSCCDHLHVSLLSYGISL